MIPVPLSGLVSTEWGLTPNVLRAPSELEDRYGISSSMEEHGLILTTEASVALVPDEALVDQASTLAKQLMGLFLSSCPNSGTEESDVEDGAS